jgi:hypothetical protein
VRPDSNSTLAREGLRGVAGTRMTCFRSIFLLNRFSKSRRSGPVPGDPAGLNRRHNVAALGVAQIRCGQWDATADAKGCCVVQRRLGHVPALQSSCMILFRYGNFVCPARLPTPRRRDSGEGKPTPRQVLRRRFRRLGRSEALMRCQRRREGELGSGGCRTIGSGTVCSASAIFASRSSRHWTNESATEQGDGRPHEQLGPLTRCREIMSLSSATWVWAWTMNSWAVIVLAICSLIFRTVADIELDQRLLLSRSAKGWSPISLDIRTGD